jgi:transcriptional regulator with PAS, ATPase and Fis domain
MILRNQRQTIDHRQRMDNKKTLQIIDQLIALCREVALGDYNQCHALFELTKTQEYPPPVTALAEAFGLMLVKVEAREYRLEALVEELTLTKKKLEEASRRLKTENQHLKSHLKDQFSPGRIVGKSPAIIKVLEAVKRVADTPVSVLIYGETGSGKELIAKSLHFSSNRRENPFVAINCSAIPETLFESELFGIEKGVATGVDKRMGKIAQASGGTLFLDEIGDLPLAGQAKLLRVIEEREVTPVGSRKAIPVDLRIVAATNKDLKEEIAKGDFREDLFYRLNVVQLVVPPLRRRPDDIELLARIFLDNYCRNMGRSAMRFSSEAMKAFKAHCWPGNVRELQNEVERAVALCIDTTIGLEDLSDTVRNDCDPTTCSPAQEVSPPGELKDVEREMIVKTLAQTGGNKTHAAKLLGITREGLRKKIKRLGL